jgi:hypothetical protein
MVHGGVALPAIGIDHDGGGVVEGRRIRRPAVTMHNRVDLRVILVEPLAQELRACPVIVRTVGMAAPAGDEYDLPLGAGRTLEFAGRGAGRHNVRTLTADADL